MEDESLGSGGALPEGESLGSGGALLEDESLGSGGAVLQGAAAANLLQLLEQVGSTPADQQLKHPDIVSLLSHPAAAGPDYNPPPSGSKSRSARAWMLLADGALASLSASSGYGPAAGRARLILPLPRYGGEKGV
ncbi:hypothetical protein D3C75_604730 [compost metagenome]